MTGQPGVVVVGSLNADLVVACQRLPRPGETVRGGDIDRLPGGKGGNQAVAAARLGARVRMVGAVGDDGDGRMLREALAGAGVDVAAVRTVAAPTGVAIVVVDERGENQIVVSPGANAFVAIEPADLAGADAVIAQLEVPLDVVERAAALSERLFCLNAAPARDLPASLLGRCDLVVVNDRERAAIAGLDEARLLAVTHGAAGASLFAGGVRIATAAAPPTAAIDTVGAGDAFTAALVVSLARGMPAAEALAFACAAGAAATTRRGAQPALPTLDEVSAILEGAG